MSHVIRELHPTLNAEDGFISNSSLHGGGAAFDVKY